MSKKEFSSNHVKDIRGEKFGKLTVREFHHSDGNKTYWVCDCDCGNTTVKNLHQVKYGRPSNCGCVPANHNRPKRNNVKTHHMTGTKLYSIWERIRSRCFCKNPSSRDYRDYAGRGITVCSEWESFENFHKWALDNGYKEGLSIDRIDNDGNYEPSNCRWVTMKDQVRNRRKTIWLTYNGEKKALSEWCEILGLNLKTCYGRLHNYGWTDPSEILFGKGVR